MSETTHCPTCHEVLKTEPGSDRLPPHCPRCKEPLLEPVGDEPTASPPDSGEPGGLWWQDADKTTASPSGPIPVPPTTSPEPPPEPAPKPDPAPIPDTSDKVIEASTPITTSPAVSAPALEATPSAESETDPDPDLSEASQNAAVVGGLAVLLAVIGCGIGWLPGLDKMAVAAGGIAIPIGLFAALLTWKRSTAALLFSLTACLLGANALVLGLYLPKVRGTPPPPTEEPRTPQQIVIVQKTGEKSIRELLQTIEADDEEVRRGGATALAKLGMEIDNAIPALTELLTNEEKHEVRTAAINALREMGAPARGAMPVLMNLERTDPIVSVRKAAALAIEEIGKPTPADVPTLVQGLGRDIQYPTYRASVAQVMTWIVNPSHDKKPILAELKIALTDATPRVRIFVAQSIWTITRTAEPAVLSEFRQAFQHRDADLRGAAAHALGMLGEAAREALPDLKVALKDEDRQVRLYAAQTVWGLEQEPHSVIPIFREALSSDDPSQRAAAAEALGLIGPAALDTVPQLLAMLDSDPVKDLRARAAFALGQIGPEADIAVPILVKLLSTNDLALCEHAVFALQGIGPAAGDAVEPLVALLDKPFPALRGRAALALAAIGPTRTRGEENLEQDEKTVAKLLEVEKITDEESVKVFLAQAMWAVDPKRPEPDTPEEKWQMSPALRRSLVILTGVLENRKLNVSIRVAAARVLGQIGPLARIAIPSLMRVQNRDQDELKQTVDLSLLTIGLPTKNDIPQLRKLLDGDDNVFLDLVVRTFWLIGRDASPAVSDLVDLLNNVEKDAPAAKPLRRNIVEALASIASPKFDKAGNPLPDPNNPVKPALTKLIAMFDDMETTDELRLSITRVFRAMGPASAPAVEVLTKALSKKQDPAVRIAILEALASLGDKSAPAVDAIRQVLAVNHSRVLSAALVALASIGQDAKPAENEIRELLKSADEWVQVSATQALRYAARDDNATVPVLLELLKSNTAQIRAISASQLGGIVASNITKKKEVVPELEKLQGSDTSLDVRKAATKALDLIHGRE